MKASDLFVNALEERGSRAHLQGTIAAPCAAKTMSHPERRRRRADPEHEGRKRQLRQVMARAMWVVGLALPTVLGYAMWRYWAVAV